MSQEWKAYRNRLRRLLFLRRIDPEQAKEFSGRVYGYYFPRAVQAYREMLSEEPSNLNLKPEVQRAVYFFTWDLAGVGPKKNRKTVDVSEVKESMRRCAQHAGAKITDLKQAVYQILFPDPGPSVDYLPTLIAKTNVQLAAAKLEKFLEKVH